MIPDFFILIVGGGFVAVLGALIYTQYQIARVARVAQERDAKLANAISKVLGYVKEKPEGEAKPEDKPKEKTTP